MAKTVSKTATIAKFAGVDLKTPVEFSYTYEELEKGDEIPAKEALDDEDMRTFVNAKRNASERAKAQSEALKAAGIEKPTLENNPQAQLNGMVKILVAAGNAEANAIEMAKGILGIK